MSRRVAAVALAATMMGAVPALRAQEALLPSTGWGTGIALTAWHFDKALPQAAGAVADVAEVALPFRIRSSVGRWNVDLSGAAAFGAAHLKNNPGTSSGGDGGDRLTTVAGPTDLKLRVTGAVYGDNTLVTVGLNLPTGKTGLTGDETATLQTIGAPAVRMPIGAFGTGAGGTLGFIQVIQGEDWAVALGASAEQRTEYSPIALILSSGKSETRVTPGAAVHVTAGYDRALGEGRWSLLFVSDVFSRDQVRATGGGHADVTNDYTLGPQYTLTSQMALAAHGWREAAFNTAVRLRSEFSDSAGAKVAGSSGTYAEASFGGVRGGSTGAGLVIGIDARWHSGLKFTEALVGAATTAAGLTIGVERAGASTLRRFTVHGQYGTFDTGTAKATGVSVTLGFSVAARREAR